jgi:UDP-N-acetylmuramyl pentapeptide synthase
MTYQPDTILNPTGQLLDAYKREDIAVRKAAKVLTWARHDDCPDRKSTVVQAALIILTRAAGAR